MIAARVRCVTVRPKTKFGTFCCYVCAVVFMAVATAGWALTGAFVGFIISAGIALPILWLLPELGITTHEGYWFSVFRRPFNYTEELVALGMAIFAIIGMGQRWDRRWQRCLSEFDLADD